MAEAEDVLTDVARHATIYVRDVWRRHRLAPPEPQTTALRDVARRLDILVSGTLGTRLPLRVAQPPARPTALTRLMWRADRPWSLQTLPATDGREIWLPRTTTSTDDASGLDRYRVWALQQATRALRGSAALVADILDPLARDLYLLIEAQAADEALGRHLPGLRPTLDRVRRDACLGRPRMGEFPPHRRPVEELLLSVLQGSSDRPPPTFPRPDTPATALAAALDMAHTIRRSLPDGVRCRSWILRDTWTGELRASQSAAASSPADAEVEEPSADASQPIRSARLARRPTERAKSEDEDDTERGAWMVQPAAPQEHAEDPLGLQRPADRDEETAAESFADSLAELPEARLVSSPGRPREILLSDDPPKPRIHLEINLSGSAEQRFTYPEWDYRALAYREPGVTVRLRPAAPGPRQWVEDTLRLRRSMIMTIRRRFEILRAQPLTLHRQFDGDEVDLEAYVQTLADYRAGLSLSQAVYKRRTPARRNMAILLLIDASGSTDAWVSDQRRVVDVEREALLLVCLALEGVADQFSVLAFSGHGPGNVRISEVKRFREAFDDRIAERIAGLEPDQYTRAGAAIRHATTDLMTQQVDHRLLLLLSDGKPNDVDQYDGRYGLEDVRQAVNEARLQGVSPFCLTIDRQAAEYLPRVFGAGHYALLPNPELLPAVLLEWIRRLVAA